MISKYTLSEKEYNVVCVVCCPVGQLVIGWSNLSIHKYIWATGVQRWERVLACIFLHSLTFLLLKRINTAFKDKICFNYYLIVNYKEKIGSKKERKPL